MWRHASQMDDSCVFDVQNPAYKPADSSRNCAGAFALFYGLCTVACVVEIHKIQGENWVDFYKEKCIKLLTKAQSCDKITQLLEKSNRATCRREKTLKNLKKVEKTLKKVLTKLGRCDIITKLSARRCRQRDSSLKIEQQRNVLKTPKILLNF